VSGFDRTERGAAFLDAQIVKRDAGASSLVQLVERARNFDEPTAAPHSVDAEVAVLGGLMIDNATFSKVREVVADSDFYRDAHRRIFRQISRLIERGEPADVVTVDEAIKASEDKDKTGGITYLAALATNTPSAANIVRYAQIVADYARLRDLQALANEIHAKAERGDPEQLKTELIERATAIRTSRKSSATMDWAALAGRGEPPARVWDVAHWIPQGHATLLAGEGGSGKSTLAQQLGSCFTLGREFIDQIHPLKSLLWACEDDANELWRRQVANAAWLEVGLEAFAGKFCIVPRLGCENTLFAEVPGQGLQFTPVLQELRAQVMDEGIDLVFIDNLAQVYGANSADAHHVTVFLNGLAGALPGRTLVLLGHPSRQQGSEFSGSAAWENACRARLYLGRRLPGEKGESEPDPADESVRYLCRRKANYSSRDWRRFEFKKGLLIPEYVGGVDDGGVIGHAREQRADTFVLEGLRTLQGRLIRATEGANSQSYLPRLLIDYKLADGYGKPELAAAMRRLRLAGRIITGIVGKYGNRTPMTGLIVVDDGLHK